MGQDNLLTNGNRNVYDVLNNINTWLSTIWINKIYSFY